MTILYNTQTGEVSRRFSPRYLVNGQPGVVSAPLVELTIVENDAPSYDPATENRIMEWIADITGATYTQTWTVTAKTEQEKIDWINGQAEMVEVDQVQLKKAVQLVLQSQLTDDELYAYVSLFPAWKVPETLSIGDKRQHEGKLYKVVQAHTTQLDWPPHAVPALFVEIAPPGVIPEWVQPTGAHDAYQIGDQVIHNGKTWESTAADNVWQPGVYGWIEI